MQHLFTCLLLLCGCVASAQNPAGQAFRTDYEEFQETGAIKYLNCGNDATLNAGSDMTIMCWLQLRDFNDNQKVVGKFNLDDSGFVFGVIEGRSYVEAWNPAFHEGINGQMLPIDLFWYHVTMTYSAGDAIKQYINGVLVGEVELADAPITANDNDFFIGVAPWLDNNSFQTFGNIDEMAYYNVALSEDEIKAQMFRGVNGDEDGLIAAWNFDTASEDEAEDVTGNGNTANGTNFSGSEWIASTAIIANEETEAGMELAGLWNGLTTTDPRFTTTTNGMNLLGIEMSNTDYTVFSHSGGSGVSTADIPSNASPMFERTERTWLLTDQSDVTVTVLLSLSQAAGGGAELNENFPAENYTLLYRPFGGTTFSAAANGSAFTSGVVTFNGVSLQSGEYALGVGDGIVENVSEELNVADVQLFPNPATETVTLDLSQLGGKVSYQIIDAMGSVVRAHSVQGNKTYTIDVSDLAAGMYTVYVSNGASAGALQLVVR